MKMNNSLSSASIKHPEAFPCGVSEKIHLFKTPRFQLPKYFPKGKKTPLAKSTDERATGKKARAFMCGGQK